MLYIIMAVNLTWVLQYTVTYVRTLYTYMHTTIQERNVYVSHRIQYPLLGNIYYSITVS